MVNIMFTYTPHFSRDDKFQFIERICSFPGSQLGIPGEYSKLEQTNDTVFYDAETFAPPKISTARFIPLSLKDADGDVKINVPEKDQLTFFDGDTVTLQLTKAEPIDTFKFIEVDKVSVLEGIDTKFMAYWKEIKLDYSIDCMTLSLTLPAKAIGATSGDISFQAEFITYMKMIVDGVSKDIDFDPQMLCRPRGSSD